MTYSYFPDIFKSPWQNALDIWSDTSFELLEAKPSQLAFHNLCVNDANDIPSSVRILLGLGLKFCPRPSESSNIKSVDITRFTKDYKRRMLFAGSPVKEIEALYYPNKEWEPPDEANRILTDRRLLFCSKIENLFDANKKKNVENLLLSQKAALAWLKLHPEYVIFHTDKNLGPAIIELEEYVRLAWRDHLSDTSTYRRLDEKEFFSRISYIRSSILSFIDKFKSIPEGEKLYITRMLEDTSSGNECSYMYLLAKIHKNPMKTRAIISYAGCLCSGLAKWVDTQLQKIVKHMPYVAKSSSNVVHDTTARQWPPGSLLFTMDAVSMYTNIHLGHALPTISNFLKTTTKGKNISTIEKLNIPAILVALEFIMMNNIFKFGDTSWLQTAGTAMGTPPAPTYATLYYAIFEYFTIPKYPELDFYNRYIDDGFGIWNLAMSSPDRWKAFQNDINSFGKSHDFFTAPNCAFRPLVWEFTELAQSAVFLDLTVSISNDGYISSTIYEKELNLHLYIPPNSCHSPGVLKGLVHGCVKRAVNLCTDKRDREPYIMKSISRLCQRGHDRYHIITLFNKAINDTNQLDPTMQKNRTHKDTGLVPLFLHLPFNPADPPSTSIQSLFRENILSPDSQEKIQSINTENPFNGLPDFDRLTICYHGQKNLSSILSPRKLRLGDFSISSHLDTLRGNN